MELSPEDIVGGASVREVEVDATAVDTTGVISVWGNVVSTMGGDGLDTVEVDEDEGDVTAVDGAQAWVNKRTAIIVTISFDFMEDTP